MQAIDNKMSWVRKADFKDDKLYENDPVYCKLWLFYWEMWLGSLSDPDASAWCPEHFPLGIVESINTASIQSFLNKYKVRLYNFFVISSTSHDHMETRGNSRPSKMIHCI